MRSSVHVGIGIIWQCALTLIAMYIVVKEGGGFVNKYIGLGYNVVNLKEELV
ncbi:MULTISPECIES: hypothetical protein [Sphingobacterium]|uniref:hypothetical protein n=1 Tax=Sphingobacterium TaxID=28453 RepID=UPI0013DCD27C|nr:MULTISPECIES: hypothetical protein [unclassified Sphingobacterium]